MTDKNYRDLLGGLLVAAIGLFAALYGQRYEFGSLQQMGPGFFPILLGAGLLLLGGAIAAPAWRRQGKAKPIRVEWRTGGLVLGSVVVFALALQTLGLVIATLAAVLLASLADRGLRWPGRLKLAAGITLLTVLIFVTGLGMIVPLWWHF